MAANIRTIGLSGLARALVQHERLPDADAENLTREANTTSSSFVERLVASGRMGAREVAEFASATFGLPLFDLNSADLDRLPADTLDRKLIRNRRILPLRRRANRLTVAVSDPSNTQALDEVKFQSGMAVDPVVVEDDKLSAAIKKYLESSTSSLRDLIDEDMVPRLPGAEPETNATEAGAGDADDAPVVKLIQKVLLDAISDGASDIHFEPFEKFYRVRFRVDGELRTVSQPPLALREKIASRIKVISRLDIAEKRVPQDGRMKIAIGKNRAIDLRVSTLPTVHGEKIVLRILDASSVALGIDALGCEPDQKSALLHAIHRPHGMILVTGPTGSGKTVTLYTCLSLLNEPGVNIATVEDPAEISLPGINQVNVNDRVGLTFAAALRAFLRQDPDVIMIGEIRDLETAEIAVKAAQTGHLVLSTLHTNDAPTTLTRLVNMGIAPFNIASSVTLIVAQRLARRLCGCRAPFNIPREVLIEAGFSEESLDGTWQPQGPIGCELCKGTGYKGRVAIFQVMPVSDEIQRIIMGGGNALEIAEQARLEGARSLRQAGLLKVRQELSSLEEIMAVTNE